MKPISKIGLALKKDDACVAEVVEILLEVLHENNVDLCYINDSNLPQLSSYGIPVIEIQDIAKRCQLILVVGGDGTFLRHVLDAARSQVPILGINCGRVGFLTEIASKEIQAVIPDILRGNYHTSNKIIIKGMVKHSKGKKKEELHSVNEIVINSLSGRMMEAKLSIDNKFVYCQRSDGIIVATSAGSSAYALSAGGALVVPNARAIEVVNISPHNLTSRPLILPDSSKIKIEIISKQAVAVFADGHNKISISTGDTVEIAKDSLTVPLIHHKDYDIFSAYRSKLGWHSASEGTQ